MRFPARRKDTTMTENSFRAEQVILPSPPYKTCWDWAKFMILLLFTWVGKHIEVRTFKGISRNSLFGWCYGVNCVLPNSYTEALIPSTLNETIFGDRVFKEVVKVK